MNPRWYSRTPCLPAPAWPARCPRASPTARGADDQPVADVQLGRPFQLLATPRAQLRLQHPHHSGAHFQTETYRQGMEFQLTRAVVRKIEAKRPTRSSPAVTPTRSNRENRPSRRTSSTSISEWRPYGPDGAAYLEVVWLSPARVKSCPGPLCRPGEPLPAEMLAAGIPADSDAADLANQSAGVLTTPKPVPPTPRIPPLVGRPSSRRSPARPPPAPPPILLSTTGDFTPELGQSIASAQQTCVDRMAVQIINMMEKPW